MKLYLRKSANLKPSYVWILHAGGRWEAWGELFYNKEEGFDGRSESVNIFLSLSVFIWHLIVVYRSVPPHPAGGTSLPQTVSFLFNDHFLALLTSVTAWEVDGEVLDARVSISSMILLDFSTDIHNLGIVIVENLETHWVYFTSLKRLIQKAQSRAFSRKNLTKKRGTTSSRI